MPLWPLISDYYAPAVGGGGGRGGGGLVSVACAVAGMALLGVRCTLRFFAVC
jgi:hypothetical protein